MTCCESQLNYGVGKLPELAREHLNIVPQIEKCILHLLRSNLCVRTIQTLRKHFWGDFQTHPLCTVQKWPISEPTQSIC